jgi:hypothetical protein
MILGNMRELNLGNIDRLLNRAATGAEANKRKQDAAPITGFGGNSASAYSVEEIDRIIREGAPDGANRSAVFHTAVGQHLDGADMKVKALELRDTGTFIPILCVDMNPTRMGTGDYTTTRYLLRRCGYPCDGRPKIIMTRLDGDGYATNDPYAWPGPARTYAVAHKWIIAHWWEIHPGDVIDVEFILGETKEKKRSERETAPL